MISTLTSFNDGIVVSNTGPRISTYSYGHNDYHTQPVPGEMRFDLRRNQMEVYDGVYWRVLEGGSAHMSLSNEIRETLDWARYKMQEDIELRELAKKHPTVDNLLKDIEEKKSQLSMVRLLIQEERKNGTV